MAVAQLPAVVSWPHALTGAGRECSFEVFLPGETLGRYVDRLGLAVAKGRVLALHNGRHIPSDLWRGLIPKAGDQIILRSWPEGGGGGNKVLRTVALVVVAVVSYGVASGAIGAGAIASASSATGISAGTLGAAAAAAISIGGSILVNALIPLPKPNTASTATSGTDNAPSYQIQAARNTSRPFEPMLLVMGGPIKVVPDLGAAASTAYVGDDQYLSQIFHFGLQPDMAITNLKIGDTPIESFQGVQLQRSGWDGNLTLAPDNVVTIQGFDLNEYQGWNTRTTPAGTYHFEIEIASILYSLDTLTGAFNPKTVVIQIEYRTVGTTTWNPFGNYTDPVYATHYWAYGVYQSLSNGESATSGTEWVQISYGSLNPADHVNGEQHTECQTWGGGDAGDNYSCQTYEWRWLPHPIQMGLPWQGIAPDPLLGYQTTEGIRITGSSNKPLRTTWTGGLPVGQYEFRFRKVSPDESTNTESNVTSITQFRCSRYTPADYSNQARLAVRIRATSQLNGPIDELSGMCTPFCNVWNGSAWVYAATRNPAWWFLWFALGKRAADGSKLYGACIPEAQIDVESIKAWAAYCDAQGWQFNYVLAQKMSAHDVLTIIARAGQASYTWQSGKLGVVWDAPNLPVVAMIGPYNIRAGTFEVSYVDATVDEIVGNFANAARDFQADQVRVRVPNAPVLNNPQTFDLEGITDATVAGRAVNLLAASQNFHRRRVSWEMDIEGYIATRGDVVQLSHDLTVWGYAGRLTGGDRNTLWLDRKVPTTGAGSWLTLRSPDGRMVNVQVNWFAGESDVLNILVPLPDDFPVPEENPDTVPMDWAWQYDPLQTPGRRLKIVSVAPTNDDGVRFEAVDDNIDYYNSITNPFAYTPPRDGALLRGIVLALSFEETIVNVSSDVIALRVDWVMSAAIRARIDYSINGIAYPSQTTQDRYITLNAHTGDIVKVTVTPVSATGLGVPKSGSWAVQGLLVPLPAVTGLTSVFRDGLTVLKWNLVSDIRQPVYEVRLGTSWQDSKTIAITPTLETLAVGDGLYFVAARFVTPAGTVVYGPADTLLISGATLVRNVLVTVDEAPAWTGTLSEDAFVFDDQLTLVATGDILSATDVLSVNDVLWYGGVANRGVYTTAESNIVDIGYPAPVRVDFSVNAYALNFEENILGVADVLAMDDVLNASNQQHYRIQPQIRRASVEGDWSEWADYVPGLINARFFDVRILMETDNPLIVPFVTSFTWTIDVPDLVQQAEGLSVPAEGLHVDFPKHFHAKPVIVITQLDAVNGDHFTLTNVTLDGFDIYFFNGTTPKAAVMNYIAQRY
ncbi:host specificity factor TipJ family phage tail protein [Bordetella bronchialis]|uniref:host specificity factor TipJ family phage tail protein n=1 Tax=Bordetella bronchialis TaxID=463025 RepID=UPI003D0857E0